MCLSFYTRSNYYYWSTRLSVLPLLNCLYKEMVRYMLKKFKGGLQNSHCCINFNFIFLSQFCQYLELSKLIDIFIILFRCTFYLWLDTVSSADIFIKLKWHQRMVYMGRFHLFLPSMGHHLFLTECVNHTTAKRIAFCVYKREMFN